MAPRTPAASPRFPKPANARLPELVETVGVTGAVVGVTGAVVGVTGAVVGVLLGVVGVVGAQGGRGNLGAAVPD